MSETATAAAPTPGQSQTTPNATPSETSNQQKPGPAETNPSQAGEKNKNPAATAAQSAKKKYKLKVDGEEFEEEFDPNDDAAVTRALQLSRAAKKRMGEAQSDKKKAFEIIKAFESDPESMLKRLGPKGREIAEKYLLGHIQEEMLSPEEKEKRDLKRRVEEYEKKELTEKETKEKAAQSEKEFKFAQSFQTTIIEALDKSGMPKTPNNVKRLAFLRSKNIELGLELSPQELAEEWAKERSQEASAEIKDMSAEQFIKIFGQDMAKKLRLHAIKELQERQGQVFQGGKKPSQPQNSGPKSKGYVTMDEWKEQVNQRIKD